ncbi:MAG: sulfatase family protein [Methylococcaceae bacterium]
MITKILLGFVLIIAIVSDAVAAPPNVILIIDDQHNRRYMSWTGLGEGIKTPSLDKLASESVAFTNAYASVPQCGPARYSMYSGRYASEHGVLQNDRPRLPHYATLQATLARSGYTTASIGKLHPAPYNARLGFQYVLNHEFYQDVAGISHFWPYLSNQVKKQGIVADRFPLWNLRLHLKRG